ncbi:hypothetical protein HGM15179_004523 [Zosterops borbonicus]|uniref:Uncharacterized protein n=1 Tax=Zosterops borbonicus TaxID=364589 RepID=A0A8K1GRR5_9PASS|nr:hypothetical protein HGM15179_004523 [Zosterops borbonicus]
MTQGVLFQLRIFCDLREKKEKTHPENLLVPKLSSPISTSNEGTGPLSQALQKVNALALPHGPNQKRRHGKASTKASQGSGLSNQNPDYGIDIFYNNQDKTIKSTHSHFANGTKLTGSVDLLEGQEAHDLAALIAAASRI